MSQTSSKRNRRNPDQTRLRLLEAGERVLQSQGASEHLNLKLADACAEAGFSTGAAYAHWNSQAEFSHDLAHHMLAKFRTDPNMIIPDLIELTSDGATLEQALRRIAPIFMARFISDGRFYSTLRFWSLSESSPDLIAALTEHIKSSHDSFADVYLGLLHIYDRRLREPFTIDDLATAITGITQGLALRFRFEPDAVANNMVIDDDTACVFSESLIAVIYRFTRPFNGADEGFFADRTDCDYG